MAETVLNLEPVSYQAVKPTEDGTYYVINPFDLNGNVLSQIVVEVDTQDVNEVFVVLPEIAVVGTSSNIQVTITSINSSGTLYVVTSGTDTISGSTEVVNPLLDVIYTLRIATPNQWTFYIPTIRPPRPTPI